MKKNQNLYIKQPTLKQSALKFTVRERRNTVEKKEKIDLWIEEYKLCLSEYAYRDRLGVTLFTVILSVITFLLAGFMLKNSIIQHNQSLFIMALGLGLLFILHLDLQKTLSCKNAMHKRAREIEEKIHAFDDCKEHFIILRCIDDRCRGFMERLSKDTLTVSYSMLRITEFFALVWILGFYKQLGGIVETFKLFSIGAP